MLTPDQLTAIDYHLRETNSLTNEALILELTDHYTNALNERMASGVTFETALTDVQQAFGGRKGLQKMERQYNKLTYKKYDVLFMDYVREQGQWPRLLLPLSFYILSFWMATNLHRPISFSFEIFTNSVWGVYALGTTAGLILQFLRLVIRHGIYRKNFSPEAIYLLTRFLPINLIQYIFCTVTVYYAQVFPPYVYEAMLSAFVTMTFIYMLSYSRFYQSILKISTKSGWPLA